MGGPVRKKGQPHPIVLINGGAIRGDTTFKKGPITYGDLLTIHSIANTIYEVSLTGKTLLSVLEMSASAIRVAGDGCLEGERVPTGGFLQVSGLRMVINSVGRPFCAEFEGKDLKQIIFPGERLVRAEVMENGKWVPVRGDRTYTVLVTSWTAGGGDGYFPFMTAKKKDTKVDIVDVLSAYIKKRSPVNPVTDGRIVIEGMPGGEK